MNDILRSKYVRRLMMVTLSIIVTFFALGAVYTGWGKMQNNRPPADFSEIATEVVPYGKYDDLVVIDKEKGMVAAINEEGIDIINYKGQVLDKVSHSDADKYIDSNIDYSEADDPIINDNPEEGKSVPYMKYGDKYIMKSKMEKSEFYPGKEYYYVADSKYRPLFNGMIFLNLNICTEKKYLYGYVYNNVDINSDKDTINKTEDVKLIVLNSNGKILYESAQQKESIWYKGEERVLRVWNGILEMERVGSQNTFIYLDVSAVERGENRVSKQIGAGNIRLNSKFIDGIAVGLNNDNKKVCLIDSNFNDLSGCVFEKAFVLKERHCAVYSQNKWSIIKLN